MRRAGPTLALDRSSSRTTDLDGRLHVQNVNLSMAAVNVYRGSEIPNWEGLGLDPAKTYPLLRDPQELEKAAASFNRLPLLSQHVPVTAQDHRPSLVVGATGSNCKFEAPFLRSELVVWSSSAIMAIDSGEQRELSAAYRYKAVMTPGTYEGTPFAGRMTDLVGNHIALVSAGRAGKDCVVGDSAQGLYERIFPHANRLKV